MSNPIDVAPLTGQAGAMMLKKLLLAIFAFASTAVASEFPSNWRFVTLKTAHFDVIVNAQQQELGRFYAARLEQAYSLLKTVYTDTPDRTIVVVADKTDLTNGYATRLPYSHIFIYPVLPGPQESLSEPGDWGLELVAHEYTHILTFDAVSGFAETLQSIFGTILSPNLLLPTWWKEGVAVESETYFSNGGRLRSGYQDSVIRALESDNTFRKFSVAEINEILPDWPQGLRPYMFGSLFWGEVVARKGTVAVDQLHQRHGGRVPYFLNGPANDVLGVDYEEMYDYAIDETSRRARKQLRELASVQPTVTTEMRLESRLTQGPQISPDGNYLALISVDERARRSIRVFARNPESKTFVDGTEIEKFVSRRESDVQPPTKDGPPEGSISRLTWLSDNKRLVFDKVDKVASTLAWSDLWVFDIETGESKRLSKDLRGREPFAAKDGHSIYFTGLDGGCTWLGRYNVDNDTHEKIWSAPLQDRIAFPAELNDGRILFSVRDGSSGVETLRVISPSGGEPQIVFANFPNARFPQPLADGGFLFTSSANGVHNVYRADAAMKTAKPVTHSVTGVYTNFLDTRNGDLYATTMTGKGPFVRHIAASEESRISNLTLPKIQPIFADRFPAKPAPETPPAPEMVQEDYSPSHYLMPRYWIPFAGVSAVNDSVVVQASTSGFDPLKEHLYSIVAEWDFGLSRANYNLQYINSATSVNYAFAATRVTSYLVNKDFPVVDDTLSVLAQPDMFAFNRYTAFGLGWLGLRTDFAGGGAERSGPIAAMTYTNFERTGEQISPEEGGAASLRVYDALPASNRLDYVQYAAAGQFFSSWPFPKRHALALRGSVNYIPKDGIAPIYGAQSSNFFRINDLPGPSYVVRGYRMGHLVGKSLGVANAEYRFPIRELRRGHGLLPFYLLRVHGAVFGDVAAVDGVAYRPDLNGFQAVSTDHPFSSFGAEARFESDIGYFIPVSLVVGFAVPSDRNFSDGPTGILSIQMGTLF